MAKGYTKQRVEEFLMLNTIMTNELEFWTQFFSQAYRFCLQNRIIYPTVLKQNDVLGELI